MSPWIPKGVPKVFVALSSVVWVVVGGSVGYYGIFVGVRLGSTLNPNSEPGRAMSLLPMVTTPLCGAIALVGTVLTCQRAPLWHFKCNLALNGGLFAVLLLFACVVLVLK
jgi:hypothetical protein